MYNFKAKTRLDCEHRKILKYVWPFFNIIHERVKAPTY